MPNFKRRKPKNARAGCLLCKPWKSNGVRTDRVDGERYSDHRRRSVAAEEVRAWQRSVALERE